MKKLIYYLSFIRSIFVSLIFVIFTFVMSLLGFLCNLLLNQKSIDNAIIKSWAKGTCWMFNVKIEVTGQENIPKSGCLFLFNHSSFFDIFALASSFSGLRFGAKIELFSIPMFGPAMRRAGTLPIIRSNRDKTFKIYEEAKDRLRHGQWFALSPEGGRFYGPQLSTFKAGPFIFAISAEAPLLPVVITGAYEAMPNGSVFANCDKWKRKVLVQVLKPIETKGFTVETRSELQKQVYDVMNPLWGESQKKLREFI